MTQPSPPPDGSPAGGSHAEPVGSLGEEAAKLLNAVAEWAREQGSDLGTGVAAFAGQAAAMARDVDAHIAAGDPECRYCPICRTVHVVREASPEVRAHLATAASSFLQAASGILAAAAPGDRAARAPSVERIDLDPDGSRGPDSDPEQDPDA